jgi:hypothetical protein
MTDSGITSAGTDSPVCSTVRATSSLSDGKKLGVGIVVDPPSSREGATGVLSTSASRIGVAMTLSPPVSCTSSPENTFGVIVGVNAEVGAGVVGTDGVESEVPSKIDGSANEMLDETVVVVVVVLASLVSVGRLSKNESMSARTASTLTLGVDAPVPGPYGSVQ